MKKVFIICIIITLLFISACNKNDSIENSEEDAVEKDNVSSDEIVSSNGQVNVYMMGRSVMGGWFEHWGYDYETPVNKQGYNLYYKELETPPEIVESAQGYVDDVQDDKAIFFFKFCFDDFWAGSKSEAKENLSQNKKYTRKICENICRNKGNKLIIGNSLPKVKEYTDSNLVWCQQEFNDWLEEYSAEYPEQVYIFDQYSYLADKKGNLKTDFALSPGDSHLNDSAYNVLDEPFFRLLNEISK